MIDNVAKARERLREIWDRPQQNEDIARVGKQQSCVKPHLSWSGGAWRCEGMGYRSGGSYTPSGAYANWKVQIDYMKTRIAMGLKY